MREKVEAFCGRERGEAGREPAAEILIPPAGEGSPRSYIHEALIRSNHA